MSQVVTRKWIKINYLYGDQYSVNKDIRFKTSILISSLCDYSDAYIVVRGRITIGGTDNATRN